MLYTLLGRVVWRIFRGYFRFAFPHARRNAVVAGALIAGGAMAFTAARRRRPE